MKLLFPGRHLLNTRFQEEHLHRILTTPFEELEFLGKKPEKGTIDEVIFAITSCNQENSRYNPISYPDRIRGVDRFAQQITRSLGIKYDIIGIPHYTPNERFAEYIIKEIEGQRREKLKLNPDNTIVMCSTPVVVQMYEKLGFSILPAELSSLEREEYRIETPIQIIRKIAELGDAWKNSQKIKEKLSSATLSLWLDQPHIPEKVIWLYKDPLLTDSGGLTETRDYLVYAVGMSNSEIIDVKFNDIRDVIKEGKIVDEGCANGALLVPIAKYFPDSDLLGIEITTRFLEDCKDAQKRGLYGGTFIHFEQRNIMNDIFEEGSIDTTICNSTTHELWSYGEQEKTIKDYLEKKFRQTRKNGRIVIRDVVGPENKDKIVYMLCNDKDGNNENIFAEFSKPEELAEHLEGLSTYARFKRFAKDYLSDMRASGKRAPETEIQYSEKTICREKYIVLKLKDAVEFMTKKDYTGNWQSELNEEFAFWSFNEWKQALKDAGFSVIENPNEPKKGSRAYVNDWIVDNRLKNKVELYEKGFGGVVKIDYPVTNMVLVGEKK